MSPPTSIGAWAAALVACALGAGAALAQAPAPAAKPAAANPAANRAARPAAARPAAAKPAALPQKPPLPEGRLWWNDPEVVATLSLREEQRAKMDAISAREPAPGAGKSRVAFHEALRAGDLERARRELGLWADGESADIRRAGETRLEILAVLDAAQRKLLSEKLPAITSLPWAKRASWAPAPAAKRAAR